MLSAEQKRKNLRRMLEEPGLIVAPGAYDALMARLIERNGFPAIHITGGGISRSLGQPDVGLLTMTETAERIGSIARSVDIPVIADADTGYGNAVNVRRTVQEMERAGAAAIHLEDEETPKKCALLTDTGHRYALISIEEMTGKIRAAVAARSDPDLLIVARVCAKGDEDFGDVMARSRAYLEAGAGAVFLIHLSPDQLATACGELRGPVMYNATWQGNWVSSFPPMDITFEQMRAMGCRIAALSSSVAIAGFIGMQRLLEAVRRDGSVFPHLRAQPEAEDMSRFYLLTGTQDAQAWEEAYLPRRAEG